MSPYNYKLHAGSERSRFLVDLSKPITLAVILLDSREGHKESCYSTHEVFGNVNQHKAKCPGFGPHSHTTELHTESQMNHWLCELLWPELLACFHVEQHQ
jgi:hypothetical protein